MLALLPLLLCLSVLRASAAASVTAGNPDGTELWGFVEVRPKANLFWWYYKSPQRVSTPSRPWPTVLWLQGGPSARANHLGLRLRERRGWASATSWRSGPSTSTSSPETRRGCRRRTSSSWTTLWGSGTVTLRTTACW
uniref:Uncharacterized protein n=1 Tax=Aegilops tauschii subsp. strangulata TaxID=200361 RepID=A0A452YKW2_AEGTS